MDENKKQTFFFFFLFAFSLAATAVAVYGVSVYANSLFVGAMLIVALIAYVWSWWKNNNVTTAATEAQKILEELKKGVGVSIVDDEDIK